MRHLEQLVQVGRSAAAVLRDEGSWIHRRVESLTFPFPDEPVYRRKISIDFSIPGGLAPIDDGVAGGRSPRYYVPLSILQKWPPLDRLDLFGEDGRPIPFLTGRQNQVLDSAVLVEMADHTTAKTPLTEDEKRKVAEIALSRGPASAVAFAAVCPSLTTHAVGAVTPAVEALRNDPTFVSLARKLCHHTILWLRTEGVADDREIVKFAYDIPWELDSGGFSRASYGLAPFVVQFDTPHVGATGSYHLNMAIPAPLRAENAELVLFDADGVESGQAIDPASVRHKATPGHPVRTPYGEFEAYADVHGPRAKFYVSGKRDGLAGRVFVGLKLQIGGFLRSASLGALLIALVIGAFAAAPDQVVTNNNSAVAVLLVVPALLAYLLRPSEHVLVVGLLTGLRRLAILGGAWPLIAAVLVIAISDEDALRWSLAAIALLEAFTGLALALPLIQNWRDRNAANTS